jgi:hypothetical protein
MKNIVMEHNFETDNSPMFIKIKITERETQYPSNNSAHNYLKGKAIPLQAWTGPEGSRRLRLPDFMTIGT